MSYDSWKTTPPDDPFSPEAAAEAEREEAEYQEYLKRKATRAELAEKVLAAVEVILALAPQPEPADKGQAGEEPRMSRLDGEERYAVVREGSHVAVGVPRTLAENFRATGEAEPPSQAVQGAPDVERALGILKVQYAHVMANNGNGVVASCIVGSELAKAIEALGGTP